ncbi:hypothetical protein H310_05045 [Aphanomyces invadans]|uniref:Uncharacterized protein n=1 Tax=Aphanomyces invadans TaxID=157072 RepID=A0A024UDD4_9STRA|nr:hypothetical protein H310_05045 [Aphanomyces invadans]ETW03648.1 hypothetical protein H310_05045 [Aphanomyces invadans]|eukprot:XP_008867877.1 hypothetical protein H310_05045 [Aphanomyces invadans]
MDGQSFESDLIAAVVARNLNEVKRLLGPIDIHNKEIKPALARSFVQAAGRDASIVHWFLELKFDVNAMDEDGDTALMVAARGEVKSFNQDTTETNIGHSKRGEKTFVESAKILAELLQQKPKPDVNLANKEGRTALIQAVVFSGDHNIVQLLLRERCDPNVVDEKRHSALHYAAAKGQIQTMKLLLHATCDVLAITMDGDSVLHKVCESGKLEAVKTILAVENVDINVENKEKQTPLMLAASNGYLDIVQELLVCGADVTKRNQIGMTALHLAISNGVDIEVVQCLVEANSDFENACTDEYSAETVLITAVISSSVSVVNYLLSKGANIHAKNKDGQTPLIAAAMHNKVKMIKLLLEHNAVVDEMDKEGSTALMKAVINLNHDATELLIENGANLQLQNKSGYTAISLAIYKKMEFGKKLYVKHQANVVKSLSSNNMAKPLQAPQVSSSSPELLHIGDYITLNLGADHEILGCDGFVCTTLKSPVANGEWDDGVFCIHPQLAYDHVDMTSTNHPYYEVIDPYSEHEREKKRNSTKLAQMLHSKEVVQPDTIVQLFHVKSQKYLRVNPMADDSMTNASLDNLASNYSWIQFSPVVSQDLVTNAEVQLMSACIPKLYKGNRKPKLVHLVDKIDDIKLYVALHCTYDPLLHHPLSIVRGSCWFSGDGLRQFPLSTSASLTLKSERMDALSAFELQKASDGTSYELRHVVSRFLLGIECPCSKTEQIGALLVNSSVTSRVAKLQIDSKDKNAPIDEENNHDNYMVNKLFQLSHICKACGNKWCLNTQENKVVWNRFESWFALDPIESGFIQKINHVCSWREAFLKVVQNEMDLGVHQATQETLRQSIQDALVASRQVCELMENPYLFGVAERIQRICSEVIFLDAMFLTASMFRSISLDDEVLSHFFKAMRLLVVGNESFEAYLVEQFEHPIGKIKILSGLDIKYASKYVDARTILTSMIGKNTRTVAYLLEAINTDTQLDTFIWTNKAQFLISLSNASRSDPLISYKLYNHEIAIAKMWLKNWDTMAAKSYTKDGEVWVRWNDSCSGRKESKNLLNRSRAISMGTLRVVSDDTSIAIPLQDIVNAFERTTVANDAINSWMISYLHHLKLVSALCRNNADTRPLFRDHFPPELLMDGACNDGLSFPIRSLYLELFELLCVPAYQVPECVQLTTLYLDVREQQSQLTLGQFKRLDMLIQSKLVPPTKQETPAMFGFIERLLITMETLINGGFYTSEKGKCAKAIEVLYSVAMAWDDEDLKFDISPQREDDPFNLLSQQSTGTSSVILCLRRLIPLARKLTRFSIVAKSQKGLKPDFKQPIVHFLSRLLNHDDKVVAQEAFMTLSELLPDHSFPWLDNDKLLCSTLKTLDHPKLLEVFSDANLIFNGGAHVVHGNVEVRGKSEDSETARKKAKSPKSGLQRAAQKINQWMSEFAKTNFVFLRLANVPSRIIAYIEDSLAKNMFVVPTNDILASEWRYYLTTVDRIDLSDNESLFLFRQSKEKILEDRVALIDSMLEVIHRLAPYLTGDLCVALLNVMVPLLHARSSLVGRVSKVVTTLLKQAYVDVDGRFTKIFNALLHHVVNSDDAGQCVLRMLRQSNSDEWKRETMVFLFHSNFDLSSVPRLPTYHIFEIICIVANGSTNESIYGHLESKALLPLDWMVSLLSHATDSGDAQRASLQLIKTMYFESDVETAWMNTELPKTIDAFQYCLRHLESNVNESVLLIGILPFVRAWNALSIKYRATNAAVREFHVAIGPILKKIAALLKDVASKHHFHCSNAEQRLDNMMKRLEVPSSCSNMLQVTLAFREIKYMYEDPRFATPVISEMDPNLKPCKSQFYKEAGKLLVDNMAPYLLYNDAHKRIPYAVLLSTKKIPHATADDDPDFRHLKAVAKYLIQMQTTRVQPDLLALIMEQQELNDVKTTTKTLSWPKTYLQKQIKLPGSNPTTKLNERKFNGKNYYTLEMPGEDDEEEDVNAVEVHDSLIHIAYKKWTSKAEPLDMQTLMESLVRLITLSSSASALGLRVFIQSLASKREIAEDVHVDDAKFLLHARLEWKKMISTAVKANATSLVFWCVGESLKESMSPMKSRLAMDLISELLADGFKEGQDALFNDYDALDDTKKVHLFQFLTSHVGGISHEVTVVTLKLFQQLCEGHHANWQHAMRSSRFSRSVIDTVINLMSRICNQAEGMFSLAAIEILTSALVFLSEVCQGPCLDNQQYLVESVVPRLCADLSLGKIQCENGKYPLPLSQLKHRANELLLSLGEGRTDNLVHNHLAELLRPQLLLDVISGNRSQIKVLRKGTKDLALAQAYFTETIELLRVVYSLLSKATASENDMLTQFSKHWDEIKLDNENVEYFAKQVISVEIVRGDSAIRVYFPQPKEAKYLRKPEKRRLLDIMNLGEDNALAAFTSTDARNLAEELRARHVLASNVEYAWMNEWQTMLRWWMFIVGFYINFVMVLGLAINPDTAEPVVHIWIEWFISVLGGVFCILCSSLWLYNVITETTFSYARQLLRPSKLRRMSRSDIKLEIWDAVGSAGYTIVGWLAIFAVIIMEYGFDDDVTFVILKVSGAYIAVLIVLSLRKIGDIYHFSYIEGEKVKSSDGLGSNMLFWFNAIIDTVTRGNFYVFTTYTLCAFMGLAHDSGYSCFLWYGLPLLDILAINARLSNILKAVTSNVAPLSVTLAFGAIVIYLFSLIGFFRYQDLMTDSASVLQCSSLMQCYFTFIHYGLLSGGGIGDYISNTLSHPLDYNSGTMFHERLMFDLAFYIFILVLLINLIMGIIIDSFTSLRESSERKLEIEMNTCLVCNDAKDDIEYRGVLGGLTNNFKRHTEEEHNLWNYLFFIMYLDSKPSTSMNGTESFAYQKLLAKDMSWLPKRKGLPTEKAVEGIVQ